MSDNTNCKNIGCGSIGYRIFCGNRCIHRMTHTHDAEIEVRTIAEFIVSLTGFGTALHVNDILPDLRSIRDKAEARGEARGRESMREEILAAIKDYKEPRFAFEEADALRSHLVKIGNFVKSLPPKQ